MAEDIRSDDPQISANPKAVAIAIECRRQEEACLYTSTTFYIWLRHARWWHRFFIVSPIILGGLAGAAFLKDTIWAAALALAAGFFPAVREALALDGDLDRISSLAAEFKNLQDAFRRTALVTAPFDSDGAERELRALSERLDAARAHSLTPAERYFKRARAKIEAGHYEFTVDELKT